MFLRKISNKGILTAQKNLLLDSLVHAPPGQDTAGATLMLMVLEHGVLDVLDDVDVLEDPLPGALAITCEVLGLAHGHQGRGCSQLADCADQGSEADWPKNLRRHNQSPNLPHSEGIGSPAVTILVLKVVQR